MPLLAEGGMLLLAEAWLRPGPARYRRVEFCSILKPSSDCEMISLF